MSQDRRTVEFAVAAGICLLSLSGLPVTVRAAPPPLLNAETAAISVSVADLDMNSQAGIAAADLRLRAAARTACRRFFDERKVDSWAAYSDCFHDSIASARRKLHASRLAARADRRN